MSRVISDEEKERNRLRSNAWAAANREKAKERAKAWYAANKERAAANFKTKWGAEPEMFRERNRKFRQENREAINAKRAALPADHPAKVAARERAAAWSAANAEKKKAADLAYYAANAERLKEGVRDNRKANPSVYAAASARKKASKAKRTPKWLTHEDHAAIAEMYRIAAQKTKETGEPWHVDHIIPLRGKLVSGLHVPSNLQVIPGAENLKKRNRFTPA